MDTALVDRLIEQCSSERSTNDFLAVDGVSHSELCLAFSTRVASGYLDGRLSFEAADRAMNTLFAFSYVDKDRGMPDLAWQIFNAFDEGEFRHRTDSPDTDSETKHTKPRIAEIVASLSSRKRA